MTVRGFTLCIALGLATAACSDDEPDAASTTTVEDTTTRSPTTTAPERQPSTTTTAFDPASVEGAVEAAYLRSWDVYADAVYNLELDEAALADVYAGEGLTTLREEIQRRIDDETPSLVRVDHSYGIAIAGSTAANVIDNITNHQTLIDPVSMRPVEEDPNQVQLLNFKMSLIDEKWRVTVIQRVAE